MVQQVLAAHPSNAKAHFGPAGGSDLSAQATTSAPARPAYMQAPVYVQAPVVITSQQVYPVYYNRPYYPPISLQFGWTDGGDRGYRGEGRRGHGHWR